MAFPIPTAKESAALVLGFIEARINQITPLLARAFNRAVAGSMALGITALFKYASDLAKQSFILTASLSSLKVLGADRGTNYKEAVAAVVTADLVANNGVTIPAGVVFIADLNGLRYFTSGSVIAAGGVAALTLSVAPADAGAAGNLDNGNTLNIRGQIDGANTEATVTGTVITGADAEDVEVYRSRVLTAYRVTTGGGNGADYKLWSEEVAGVKRAYPYSGLPLGDPGTPVPPERVVYVESTTAIDPDGVPTTALLDAVRASITTDPETGKHRQSLGLTDSTLFVVGITRRPVFVEVEGLVVDAAKEAQAKADINSALDAYTALVAMFVVGVDFETDKNDIITIAAIGGVVTDALAATGGTITTVKWGFTASHTETTYTLLPGELVNNNGATYV